MGSLKRVPTTLSTLLAFAGVVNDQTPRILNYHSIGVDGGYDNIPESEFRDQIRYLSDRYEVVSLDEMVSSSDTDAKQVAITFDDGLASFGRNAVPILEAFDVPATVYVIGGAVGTGDTSEIETIRSERLRTPEELLGRAELETLVDSPYVTIGAHTRTHPPLPSISGRSRLETEIVGGKEVLEDALDISIDHFAYPYNEWDRDTYRIVQREFETGVHGGGHGSFITELTDRHLLPRIDQCVETDRLQYVLSDLSIYLNLGMSDIFSSSPSR